MRMRLQSLKKVTSVHAHIAILRRYDLT